MTRIATLILSMCAAGSVFLIAAAQAEAQTTIIVNTSGDGPVGSSTPDCSLRDAIATINANGVGVGGCQSGSAPYTIRFAPGITTVVLSLPGGDEDQNQTGDLDLLSNAAIRVVGPVTITALPTFGDRLIDVRASAVLTFERVTLTGGRPSDVESDPSGYGPGGDVNSYRWPYSNPCTRGGGAVRAETGGATLHFYESLVADNRTGAYRYYVTDTTQHIIPIGAGVCAVNVVEFRSENSEWARNTEAVAYSSQWGGGAIAVTGGPVHIVNSRFISNSADTASSLGTYATATFITNSQFISAYRGWDISVFTGTLVMRNVIARGPGASTGRTNGLLIAWDRLSHCVQRAQIEDVEFTEYGAYGVYIHHCANSVEITRATMHRNGASGAFILWGVRQGQPVVTMTEVLMQRNALYYSDHGGIYSYGYLWLSNARILSHGYPNGPRAVGLINGGYAWLNNVVISGTFGSWGDGQAAGGILNSGWLLHITNSQVISNHGVNGGGGIANRGGGEVLLFNTLVASNTTGVGGRGGGIHGANPNERIFVISSTIRDNRAQGDGGGIYATGLLSVTQSQIYNNRANVAGGGVNVAVNGRAHLLSATLYSNRAGFLGGGVRVESDGAVFITHTQIVTNQADGDGGGVQAYSGRVVLSRTLIANNRTRTNGGGLALNNAVLQAVNSLVERNDASASGGAIYAASEARVMLTDTQLLTNVATNGGGLYAVYDTTVHSAGDNEVRNNRAYRDGGGLALTEGSAGDLGGLRIINNRAQNGGGILASSSTITLSLGAVRGNSASERGGGVFADNNSTVRLDQVEVTNNSSGLGEGGGVFAARGSLVDMQRSAAVGNSPEGIAASAQGGNAPTVRLVNVTVSNNGVVGISANDGAVISATHTTVASHTIGVRSIGGAAVSLEASIVAYNGQGCVGNPVGVGDNLSSDATCATFTITNTDPLLQPLAYNGGATLNHALPVYSPAVDRTTTAIGEDQRGIPRPQGARHDLGAYEVEAVNLQVRKQAQPLVVNGGGVVTFVVTVRNASAYAAPGVVVTDTLSGGAVLGQVAGTSPNVGSVQTSTTVITFTVAGALAPGQSATLTYTVIAPMMGTFSNTAVAASAVQELDSSDNITSVTVLVVSADVVLEKRVTPTIADPGTLVTYTLIVRNTGPVSTTNLVVTDVIQGGASINAVIGSANVDSVTHAGTVLTFTTSVLNVGDYAVVTYTAMMPSSFGFVISNTATAQHAVPELNASNNTATATVLLLTADISVTKRAHLDPTGLVTYEVSVHNLGPMTSTGIVVSDTLQGAGVVNGVVLSHNVSTLSFGPSGVVFTVASLPAGSTATVTYTVNITLGQLVTNTVRAQSQTTDFDLGNNQTSRVVRIQSTDLAVSKMAYPDLDSGVITYVVTITNFGPLPATNVVLTDVSNLASFFLNSFELPPGSHLVTAQAEDLMQPQAANNYSLFIGSIGVGQSVQVTYVARAPTGTVVVNIATVFSQDMLDPRPQNNVASVTIGLVRASLWVRKLQQPPDGGVVPPGGLVTYTVVVTNITTTMMSNVAIQDTLPNGVSIHSVTPSPAGSCSTFSGMVFCSVGNLSNGQSAQVQIVVQAPQTVGVVLRNRAEATSSADPYSPAQSNEVSVRVGYYVWIPMAQK